MRGPAYKARAMRLGLPVLLFTLGVIVGAAIVLGKIGGRPPVEQADPASLATDPARFIDLHSQPDVALKRERLIQYIWRGRGFPSSRMPDEVEQGIAEDRFARIEGLQRVTRLRVRMDYGIDSVVYYMEPRQTAHTLVLYHLGHEQDPAQNQPVIQALLQHGYSVIAFWMPLYGENSRPVVELPRFGRFQLAAHDQLALLASDDLSPIEFFLEPVAACLNYALHGSAYTTVAMVGLSGGGWTTTLYAAIDPRISRSYPVAGSLPIYLRSERDWGDYEQTLPDLYEIANYLELYILGAQGEGRGQLQILNLYDPCCFSGAKGKGYESAVQSRLRQLGQGSFAVQVDDTHSEHEISEHALELIIADLQQPR